MLKKISTLIEYVGWLYKQNAQLQQASGCIFRIVKNEKNTRGEHILHIQVINKSTIFQCLAKEVAANDQLLECFSKSDVRIITYLATEDLFLPKNKILAHEYNDELQRTVLTIGVHGKNESMQITADKVSLNNDMLKTLSREDAHRAGYLMALEQMELERKAIEKLNDKSK